jgi:hypothetical protein
MTHELLDLKRIRRNWSRADTALLEPPPDRLGHVQPPLDVYREGAALLARLRTELRDQFPEQRARLAPFLARVDDSLVRARTVADGGEEAREERGELVAALHDLEDLCEALLIVRP